MSTSHSPVYDFAVVGGGIVGLATSLALSEAYPKATLLVLEKENAWAFHQTGHNSGVIHSGIYYAPGSMKARLAREGNRAMVRFCQEYGISHERCGKMIVATDQAERVLLAKLLERGRANGLELTQLDREKLREREPTVAGIEAILVESAGIVDYKQVAAQMVALLEERGTQLLLNSQVVRINSRAFPLEIATRQGTHRARFLINCAGLHCDHVARLAGARPKAHIVPFRGEYYTLSPQRTNLVKSLVYPVPNPAFPFLGVHFTRMINGEVHAGPNAVLALKREGYRKSDFSLRNTLEVATFPGFWRLAARNWREAWKEYKRSFSKAQFVASLKRLVPEVEEQDLVPAEAGVRAQALEPSGKLVDDFLIVPGRHSIHVCNAPSPAATASIEIGRYIASRAGEQ